METQHTEDQEKAIPLNQSIENVHPGAKIPDNHLRSSSDEAAEVNHLNGWRLALTTLGIIISALIINLEVSIVSTSLVSITDDLKGFKQTSWVVSGYLITYTGFMILATKLSDVFGRKHCMVTGLALFTAFSGGCGGARTMTQLIVCRFFQGVGAAATYSMTVLITYEMVPKVKVPLYGGLNSIAVALATVMGPLFGGIITEHTTWRWVFYLNLPTGAFAIALFMLALPNNFPYHGTGLLKAKKQPHSYLDYLKTIDILGAFLVLGGSLLLSTALLETSNRFSWHYGGTIALLVLAGLCWIGFFAWEWFVSLRIRKQEPLFPWNFVYNRPWMGMILSSCLSGVPFNALVIYIPQRIQTVSGMSPLAAGIRLLPYSFGVAFGAVLASVASSKRRVAVTNILLFGASLQVIGIALLSTQSGTSHIPKKVYGFEALAGIGMGASFGVLVFATPFVVEPKDLAVATGAIMQFRFLGGVIGLAIGSSIMNSRIKSGLEHILIQEVIGELLQSVEVLKLLPLAVKGRAIQLFADMYNLQDKVMIAFAAAQIPAVALIWNRQWSKIG
ncbi:putative efflux pump antibiotic resistance protein [Zopfia rhizophila CBS 207.26]|uniref:Putative efflux pump antibiotic resistance protein n=1 Tax=Zopfia rhizophila CBS 207.26 TaxID=1314779 RepID=A0A6A6DS09_9PEZI|nr:putative efflux pump antibiotic resistance protein [Zopfia rhizophila CBS 207.26]